MRNAYTIPAIMVTSLVVAAWIFPNVLMFPNGFIEDDGYFYSKIGFNIATAGHSSFDTINVTSGYHLLWEGVLAALSFMLSWATTDLAIHLYFHLALFLLVCFVAATVAEKRQVATCVLALSMLTAGFLMESCLLALLLAVLLTAYIDNREIDSPNTALLATFLIPLTRIDSTVILIPVLAILIYQNGRREIRFAAAACAGVALHFTLMVLFFGHLASVSSMLKVSGIEYSQIIQNLISNAVRNPAQLSRFAAVCVLFASAALVILQTDGGWLRQRRIAVAVGALAFYVPHMIAPGFRGWYYIPVFMTLYLAGFRNVELERWVGRGYAVFAAFVVSFQVAGHLLIALKYPVDRLNSALLIREIHDQVPAGQKIYQIDGSGFVGFFADRPVINGDGLVNSYRYAAALRQGQLANYLANEKICYLILDTVQSDKTAPLINNGGLVVSSGDVELLFDAKPLGSFPYAACRLYRLRRSDCNFAATSGSASRKS